MRFGVLGREEKESVVSEAWVGGVELLGKGWGCLLFWGEGEREITCGSFLCSIGLALW